MKLIILLFVLVNISVSNSMAESKLTLTSLEKQHYKEMTGKEISELLLGKTVTLKDLLSKAIYEVKINNEGLTKKKVIKEKSPKTLTSIEYNSRAALLSDGLEISIKGNKIVTSDGVRTYMSTLYKKQNTIYGVRDIDHNSVNFQIIIEN